MSLICTIIRLHLSSKVKSLTFRHVHKVDFTIFRLSLSKVVHLSDSFNNNSDFPFNRLNLYMIEEPKEMVV